MEPTLRDLLHEFPLERRWRTPELFPESLVLGDSTFHLVGLCAEDASGRQLTASAAGGSDALRRAYFELLERSAALAASEAGSPLLLRDAAGIPQAELAVERIFPPEPSRSRYRHSLSNGVAARPTWGLACRASWLEAIERDRVLRSWFFGPEPPEEISGDPGSLGDLPARYEIRSHRFLDPDDPCQDVEVCGVFWFPRRSADPFVWGFGAGRSLTEALRKAQVEGLQRLGFLSGEPLPDSAPAPTATPTFHLDFHLYPPHQERIRCWLTDGHPPTPASAPVPTLSAAPLFVDLTPPGLSGHASVARVFDPGRMPLVFGEGHPWLDPASQTRVHPVA